MACASFTRGPVEHDFTGPMRGWCVDLGHVERGGKVIHATGYSIPRVSDGDLVTLPFEGGFMVYEASDVLYPRPGGCAWGCRLHFLRRGT